MPFAVFRRHQRKLLAIFAILAMVGFVLSDSLPAIIRSSGFTQKGDTLITELYGKPVYRSNLDRLNQERRLANAFMANLMMRFTGFSQPQIFGDTDTAALVDAYILQHEADALGLPAGSDLAREWLRQITGGQMDANLFEGLLAPFRHQNVTGEFMLEVLAGQIRLSQVRMLPGQPDVTPLDVYEAYRDRYERVSARAVGFPADDYVSQVKEPSDAELKAYYDRYKNLLPDPHRDTPGFKIPRMVQVEYVVVDSEAIARDLREKLTEKELRDYYETRKSEFSLPALDALPVSLFADDPKNTLTPPPAKPSDASPETVPDTGPRYKPFEDVRATLESDLSREKAREVVNAKFDGLREVMLNFADSYNDALEDQKEAKTRGDTRMKPLPRKPDLKPVAQKAGLTPEMSPLLAREAAEQYGQIASSHAGLSRQSEGRKFAEEMFESRATLFEPIELVNNRGDVFLTWKIADNAPRVPPFNEIRTQVVHAWKLEQARTPALQAAQNLADKVRKAGGKLNDETAGGRRVMTTDPVSKLETQVLPMPGQFSPPRPRPTDISQIPYASDALREALFNLEPGDVAVEPNQPKSAYYVLTLDKRYPVSYTSLYAPSGSLRILQVETREEAQHRRLDSWMAELRAKAGMKPDWTPPEEAETRPSRRPR